MKKVSLFSIFIANVLIPTFFCEKTEVLPVGDILSATSQIGELLSNKDEITTPVSETVPRIHLKIVPSKKLHITQSDMTFLLTELKQEIRRQIAILADELEQKERMRQRAASIASISERLVFPPENEEEEEEEEKEMAKTNKEDEVKESASDVAELIDSLKDIVDKDNVEVKENRTYDIKIERKSDEKNTPESNFLNIRTKSFRNGPFTD